MSCSPNEIVCSSQGVSLIMTDLKQKVIHGVFWRALERFGTQGISFVVSIILARLLGPEEYGTIALLYIFLAIAGVLVDSGFGTALIQKKEADDLDFNSIFYFNLVVSVVLYGVLWFAAPWIADFYDKPILIPVLRWSALTLMLNGVNGIQNAVLAREMKFNLSFWISLSGTISQGVIGISMAYMGYGLWALVFSSLGSQAISTLARWFLIGWTPSLQFSLGRVRQLFGFGSRMMLSGVLDTFFNQVYGLLIGKWYTPADLAYFNRGDSMPNMVMTSVQGVIGSVAFPALSKLQDEKEKLKSVMRRMMLTSSFIVFPAMFGLAAVAKPLVLLLLTEKWLPAVPYLQLACISYAFWPIHIANLQVIQACGRSDIFLNLEIIKKILLILSILLTFKYGVLALACGRATLGPIFAVINAFPCKKLIGYSPIEQTWDIAPNLMIGCLASILAYLPLLMIENTYLLLAIQVLIGMIVFTGTAFMFKIESVTYLLKNMKQAICA